MVSHVKISQLLACLSTSLQQIVFAVVVPSCQKIVDNFSQALHECLYNTDANVVNGLKNSSSYEPTGEKSLVLDESTPRKSKLKFMQINKILYHSIQTLIKNVFLLNFAHELLMSFLRLVTREF